MTKRAYIKAITSYLPEKIENNDKSQRLTKKTGIYERHIVEENECASDLAFCAVERLFEQYNIERNQIDFIILCTQSPDYILPTTACILQNRLGLSKQCGAFDFNLGCSGYVYGLSIAKGLIETNQASNILFITAETYSKWIHPNDQTVKPLFGDGATVTLVAATTEEKENIHSLCFGTDGAGFEHLIVPVGGARNPYHSNDQIEVMGQNGICRTNHHLYMNGQEISKFALDVVPEVVASVLDKSLLKKTDIDYFIFHQANKFMLDYLQQKCELQERPFYNNPAECGNTVSSSIPLAIEQLILKQGNSSLNQVMLVGFGVGLSWAGGIVDLTKVLKI